MPAKGQENPMNIRPKLPEIAVTTGAIAGSRKIYVGDLRVPMREIALEGEKPFTVYDTSGAYSDPDAVIDIYKGLAPLRESWIEARNDTERYEGRTLQEADNGFAGTKLVPSFPARKN